MTDAVYWDDELRDSRGRVIDTGTDLQDEETGNYFVFRDNGSIPSTLRNLSDPTKDIVVAVVWTKIPFRRHGFHSTVSVQGNLQRHPDFGNKYRVLVAQAQYAYVDEKDVAAVGGRPITRFKDGSHAVIYLA